MPVIINNQQFESEILTKTEDIENGMMGRNSLNGCMVFKLNKGYHSFWMKNCLINLDIIFVLNGKITKIHLNCTPPDSHSMNPPKYSGIGNYVIEFPAGDANNFKINDKVFIYH